MADIPMGKPKAGDAGQSQDEDRIPLEPKEEPLTFATPDYKQNNPPTYPSLAKRRRYEGTVLLDVLVSRSGMVDSIKLAQSSGHQVLDRTAIKAVREWSFHPGKKGDEPREMWVTIPIRFQL
jgi:protein TonB